MEITIAKKNKYAMNDLDNPKTFKQYHIYTYQGKQFFPDLTTKGTKGKYHKKPPKTPEQIQLTKTKLISDRKGYNKAYYDANKEFILAKRLSNTSLNV